MQMEKFLGKVGKFIDLTGNVYNHLTVICRGEDLIKKMGNMKLDGYVNVIAEIQIIY